MYGLRIKGSNNLELFTTEDTNWSFIGSFIAPAGGNNSLTNAALSVIGEVLIQKTLVNAAPNNQEAYVHNCTRTGNTVTATHGPNAGTVDTLVVVMAR